MPLPGGASDKAGNRYELLWTATCLVDILLGRSNSIKLEPPDADGIEFCLEKTDSAEVHQVKRGNSSKGRWNISDLEKVLVSFKGYLIRDELFSCVFISSHAVQDLAELSERVRDSVDFEEFQSLFLTSITLKNAFSTLTEVWSLDAPRIWSLLRRAHFETISEQQLRNQLDQLLDILFDGAGQTTRAALCQLILESTHQTLAAESIVAYLEGCDIRRSPVTPIPASASLFTPPTAIELIGRDDILNLCTKALEERHTLVVTGASGIGKSSIAAKVCSTAPYKRAIWIDCSPYDGVRASLSNLEVIGGDFGENELARLLAQPSLPPQLVGSVVADFLNRHCLVLVWDSVNLTAEDAALLEGISNRLRQGAQIVTTVNVDVFERLGWAELVELPPLEDDAVIAMFRKLTGQRPSKEFVELIHGHPVFVQLAARAASRLTEHDLCALLHNKGAEWLDSSVLKSLGNNQRTLLEECSIYRSGFAREWVAETPEEYDVLRKLAMAHLVDAAPGNRYRVHDMVRSLVERQISAERLDTLHRKVADRIRASNDTTLPTLREYAHHALHAGMKREATRVIAGLVDYAAHSGNWLLVLDLTNSFDSDTGDESSFVWFQRGRALRLMNEYEGALQCYRRAQVSGEGERVETSRSEEAAMLAYLDKEDEAINIYEDLVQSSSMEISLHARGSLALILGENGENERARHLLEEAIELARLHGHWRVELQSEQVLGRLELSAGNYDDARQHLKNCYDQRMVHAEESLGPDIIGWHDLYRCLINVETALGNRGHAWSASIGLLKFSIKSGNPLWIAEAAYELSVVVGVGDDDDDEALEARRNLGLMIENATSDQPIRTMVGYLAASHWCSGELNKALRLVLEYDRESDNGIPVGFRVVENQEAKDGESSGWSWRCAHFLNGGLLFDLPDGVSVGDVGAMMQKLCLEYPESDRVITHFESAEK